MNIIQRIHGTGQANTHAHGDETHSHDTPFWVRHYDKIVGFITLGRTEKMHNGTIALANLQSGEAILDVGCGTGKLILKAEKVVGHSGTAVGLDVEPAMVAQAQNNATKTHSHSTFGVASIDNIPYPDNSFDVVVSSLVYHHLSPQQKQDGFREVMRVLKPNGRFLIADLNPSRRSIATSLPGHNQLTHEDHVRNEVTEQMQTAGFSNIEAGTHPYKQLSYAIGVKI